MSHLEQPIDQVAGETVLRLYIATITTDHERMTIVKSKEPILRSILLMYSTATGLTCAMMGLTFLVPGFPQVWRMPEAWAFYLICFAILTLASNIQSLPDLAKSDTLIFDQRQGTVTWNGQYACEIREIESVRLWTRLYNGLTRYRISLMLTNGRAFHLVETTPENFEEYVRYAVRSSLRPVFWPFTDWKPYPSAPTGGDNGKNDQFAFAWILARFLNVPIQ